LGHAWGKQGLADGVSADGPQVAVGQLTTGPQGQVLQGGLCAAGLVGRVRAVGPIDAVESLALGTPDPAGDGGDAHAELASDGTQGPPSPDGSYHGAATLPLTLCLLMGLPHDGSVLGEL